MSKRAELTLGIATICYIAVVYLYKGDVPSYYFFPVKLYDFVLGMYLAKKLDVPVKKWSLVFCLAWIAMVLIPWNLPIDENFLNVICSLCVFLGFYHLEDVTAGKVLMGNNGVRILADCSYEMFLVHHWGIILMSQILGPTTLPTAVLYLAAELVVVVLIGFVLHYVISQLLFYIRQGSFRISS
jgi:peptidoglycan/LPS O-acetylase OafA/YrhL